MPIFSLIIGVIIVILLLIVAVVVCAIGQTIWTGLCFGVVYLVRPKGKRAIWLVGSVPLFIPAYVIALIVLVWSNWPDKYTAYEIAFDTTVSPTVTVYSGEITGWGDWEEIELHFNATPADIQAITARGLTLDPNYASTSQYHSSTNSYIQLTGKDVYTGGSPNQRFYTIDEAVLVYDPATGDAWYWYDGID